MKLCVVPVHNLLIAALTAGSTCAIAAGILTPAALAQTATARAAIALTARPLTIASSRGCIRVNAGDKNVSRELYKYLVEKRKSPAERAKAAAYWARSQQ